MEATDALSFVQVAASPETALDCLAEPVRHWFRATFAEPTPAQRLAWPVVARGDSLLLSTPTGSGKTLAAFLPLLGPMLTEPTPGLRCLYLAPLKALSRDARKNLKSHCRAIEALQPGGPRLRIALRTGDTSPRARQRQIADPPHVLLTTPESLAVLLSQPYAAELFRGLRSVVIDEVHALACDKRGADLALSLERLERLPDRPMQRIGLSATCAPLTVAARFLVGAGRSCRIAQVGDTAGMELHVEPLPFEAGPGFLNRLLHRLDPELHANRTTLIFTNTRSLAERVTWALRNKYPDRAEEVGVHHSALAPARRRAVERQLKQGRLWVAVSSTSLELGIDIGSVDHVVFVHPPGSVVRLLQRLGRSGHGPDRLRRGLVLTCSSGELLEAAVTAGSGQQGQVEPLDVPRHPFDVLCQHLVGLAMAGAWTADDAFALLRRAAPYHDLSRDDFDACLAYLSGRHRESSAGLPTRLRWDGDTFTIVDDRTAKLLRRNLGTILSEDPCTIRMQLAADDSDDRPRTSLVGEVEEAYANRLEPGDRFMLDGRCLELRRRTGKELLVEEVLGRPQVPRWRGAGVPMSAELARRLYLFRVQAAEALRDGRPALEGFLRQEQLGDRAIDALSRFFAQQETTSEVPDLTTLLIERLAYQGCVEYYFHTPLPRPANEALLRVLSGRLLSVLSQRAIALAADLGFLVVFERHCLLEPDAWRALLAAGRFAEDFAAGLSDSDLLRERFGQVAKTGLLALRQPGRWRKGGVPKWLFDRVRAADPAFVLLRQAEHEARHEACDLAAALEYLRALPRLQVRLRPLAQPSPFADHLLASNFGPLETPLTPDEALGQLQQELLQSRVG